MSDFKAREKFLETQKVKMNFLKKKEAIARAKQEHLTRKSQI